MKKYFGPVFLIASVIIAITLIRNKPTAEIKEVEKNIPFVKQVYTKDNLKLMGLTTENFGDLDNSDLWLSNTQLITVWPSDPDLKLVGEDIYFGENPMDTLKPINENEIPDYYKIN